MPVRKKEHQRNRGRRAVEPHLGDAVEAAHERVQRVEETQGVVQVSGQLRAVVYK